MLMKLWPSLMELAAQRQLRSEKGKRNRGALSFTIFRPFSEMFGPSRDDPSQGASWPSQFSAAGPVDQSRIDGNEDSRWHRPPNSFLLYCQAMRSAVRQENLGLSNTEATRVLGKMWKEVPIELKLAYKHQAAVLQEAFKREHPDYTYRTARMKRALNEPLAKGSQGLDPMMMQDDAVAVDQQMFAEGGMFPGMQQQFAAQSPSVSQGMGAPRMMPGAVVPGMEGAPQQMMYQTQSGQFRKQ
jgi:transcription factor SOX7/8/10/18 (SOX group E/F)